MMRTIYVYFLRRYLASFFSALAAVFALVYLVDVIELSRRGKFDDVSFAFLAAISALRVPGFVEQALPFLVLFASIFTLLALNRRSELVVARAAGFSVWQMLWPFLVGSAILGIAATLFYNPLSAKAQAMSDRLEARVSGAPPSNTRGAPWLRQSAEGVESLIGAKTVADNGVTLGGVSAFVLDGAGTPTERIDAATARLEPGAWILRDAKVSTLGSPPEPRPTFRLPTSLRPEYVEQRLADPEAIPIWDLYGKIEIARTLGYNASAFAMHLNALVAKPALFIAMTLLASTVAVRFARTGQSARTILGGIAAGFTLYVVTFLAQALGSNAVVPPVIAAWFPVVAAGSFGVTILLHQEDG